MRPHSGIIIPSRSKAFHSHFYLPRRWRDLLLGGPQIGLRGRVENVLVLNTDGSVAYETGPFDNLIVNAGLDKVFSVPIAGCFTHCRVGTGSNPPSENQTMLLSQAAWTSTYLQGSGNCGTTLLNPYTIQMKRTYDFPIGLLNGNYGELGFSDGANTTLFSAVQIQSGGQPTAVTVNSNQQLRVVYTLTTVLGPSEHTAREVTITGLGPIAGIDAIQQTGFISTNVNAALRMVLSSGQTDSSVNSSGMSLEPSLSRSSFVSTSSANLASVGQHVSRENTSNKFASNHSYQSGSYYIDKELSLETAEGNAVLRSCGLGTASTHAYAFVFDNGINKLNTHTLNLVFRISVARA